KARADAKQGVAQNVAAAVTTTPERTAASLFEGLGDAVRASAHQSDAYETCRDQHAPALGHSAATAYLKAARDRIASFKTSLGATAQKLPANQRPRATREGKLQIARYLTQLSSALKDVASRKLRLWVTGTARAQEMQKKFRDAFDGDARAVPQELETA